MAAELGTGGGWTVVATLRHRPGRPTRVELAGAGERINSDAWSRSEGWCEHCRTRRARRTTYLLRHTDGRLAQVGSSCLDEFTGQPKRPPTRRPPRRRPDTRHPGARDRELADYVDTGAYLAQVAQMIFDSGFTSAAVATRGKPATWSQALAALDRRHAPSARAQRRADQALQWVRGELACGARPDSFDGRLVRVLSQARLTRRELPTAAAGIYAYHAHLRRQIANREKAVGASPRS